MLIFIIWMRLFILLLSKEGIKNMHKINDVLTGIMMIVSSLITFVIVAIGAYFFLQRVEFISLTILFTLVFLTLYTFRNIYIGLNLIFCGRYRDEMTVLENRRYSD